MLKRHSFSIRKILIIITIGITQSSCQTFTPVTTQIDRDGIDIISTNSDSKIAFIKARGQSEMLCAPREGDMADTYSSGLSLGYSVAGQSDSISDSDSKGTISLGGRSPNVLLAREFMFRACELSLNINADGKTTIEVYQLFLEKLIELSNHNSGNGTQSITSNLQQPVEESENESPSTPSVPPSADDQKDNKQDCDSLNDWRCTSDN